MDTKQHFRWHPDSCAKNDWRPLLLVILAFTGLAATATAQEFRTDPVEDKLRVVGVNPKAWTGDPANYTANSAKLAEFFDKCYFADMTRTGDADLGRLGDSRSKLFKQFLWATSNEQLQHDLTDQALAKMQKIVTAHDPPYHPAVRYNAVLIIGMLDEQYAIETGAGRRPPKPLTKANEFLTLIVNLAADDKPVPPGVVFGALIGLERHAQFRDSLTPEVMNPMTAALLKLLNHDAPMQDMDRDAYSWMRLRAASALAKLGSAGEKNAVHAAIVKLASSSKSLDDRCAAAGLLEKIVYKDAKLDDAGTAEPLFALTRDLAAAEDKRAQEYQDEYGGGGGIARGPEGFGPGGISGTSETFPRRQVLARLTDLRNGLKTVKPALPAETQKKVDAVLAAINPVITAASSKDTVELRLADSIRKMAEEIIVAVPAAEKPAADTTSDAL